MDTSKTNSNYNYKNMEISQTGGKKIVRKVEIKNGKGYKMISKYNKKGKHIKTKKILIDPNQIKLIKAGKFIPGFFKDCNCNDKKNKTKNNRKMIF
jgi:hypothetical protein